MDHKPHQVVVVFLGGVREAAGCPSVQMAIDPKATLADVEILLTAQFPQIATWIPHIRYALDSQYVARGDCVGRATEIALIPPVAGG